MQLPLVAATTVGSFPRPVWLADTERAWARFKLEGEVLHEAQDDATLVSIREQEEAGLDLVSDGEQRRTGFINHVLAAWDGFDLVNLKPKAIRRRADVFIDVPCVIGKVSRRSQAVVEDLRFAKAHASKPVKIDVPGPMTVVDTTHDDAYGGDEEALAMDVAAALNAEILALQEAGCDAVQIDEPAMTRHHEKVAQYGARALERCLEGVTIPTFVHLCYGYPGVTARQHTYEYPELLDILMETSIGGFSVEFARSGFDPAVLAAVKGRMVMYGCVDPSDNQEPASVVAERARAALRYVEPDRLLLAPDCGLMTIGRELARAKARLLAETASEIRTTL